jgi:hypothetical protein
MLKRTFPENLLEFLPRCSMDIETSADVVVKIESDTLYKPKLLLCLRLRHDHVERKKVFSLLKICCTLSKFAILQR